MISPVLLAHCFAIAILPGLLVKQSVSTPIRGNMLNIGTFE